MFLFFGNYFHSSRKYDLFKAKQLLVAQVNINGCLEKEMKIDMWHILDYSFPTHLIFIVFCFEIYIFTTLLLMSDKPYKAVAIMLG